MTVPSIIVDYQLGNMYSIQKACEHVGLSAEISSDADRISDSRLLILPGVGAFGQAMSNLHRLGLIDPLMRHVDQDKPLVGICLGMQLLFDQSEEFGCINGLGIIPGQVQRLPSQVQGRKIRVPHMGWNRLQAVAAAREPLFDHLNGHTDAYFVHSFHAVPDDATVITAFAQFHGFRFCAAVRRGNVCGLQFHPEKSGPEGLRIIANINEEMVP